MKKITNDRTGTKMKTSGLIKNEASDLTLPFSLKAGRNRNRQFLWNDKDFYPQKFKIDLYRYLRDNIPLLNACVWTWSRLSSAPGKFEIIGTSSESEQKRALDFLEQMSLRIYPFEYHHGAGLESFFPLMFNSLFTDGAFAGFAVISPDCGGVEKFQPIDPSFIRAARDNRDVGYLLLQTENGEIRIDGDDFYYFGLNCDINGGLGRSILSAVPFVSYIEQQLVDDMRRTTHNAGYHRLHVRITPPEKMSGESDNAYVDRVNDYFDETVSMIKGANPEDNPVTWDNVVIDYIGPRSTQGSTQSWFINHRAMVEEICGGTHLSPFMLGYSYGSTHNWAQFKYDLVMRHVHSIQRQTSRFMEWLGHIELALKGMNCKCRFVFDNHLTYLASDRADIEKSKVENIIKLYSAGLISKEAAAGKAVDLI
jgi:hypothetical protein